jgi:plasmid stabilization system protein ParE
VSAKKALVLLTDRVLAELAEIDAHSAHERGRRSATKYLKDFEAALGRLQENPQLLRPEPDFHPSRIAELEPTLVAEVDLLRKKLHQGKER